MRKSVAVILAAGFVAVLSGCGAVSTPAQCDPPVAAGDASALISATGKIGSEPKVSFPTPVITTKFETSVLTEGKGSTLAAGEVADIQVSVFVGKTGELLTSSDYGATPLRLTVGQHESAADEPLGAIAEAAECHTVGSRLGATLTVKELFGSGKLDPSLGLADGDALIFVTDITRGYPGRADGAVQVVQPGFPAVVTAPNGAPGITLPNENPPSTVEVEKLRVGDGDKIKKSDSVVVNYTGVIWNKNGEKGTVFGSSWDTGQPYTFSATKWTSDNESGMVPGLLTSLVGQTVGSQVVVVVPPKQGYPTGGNTSVPDGSTMVFVIDILGIQ